MTLTPLEQIESARECWTDAKRNLECAERSLTAMERRNESESYVVPYRAHIVILQDCVERAKLDLDQAIALAY